MKERKTYVSDVGLTLLSNKFLRQVSGYYYPTLELTSQ